MDSVTIYAAKELVIHNQRRKSQSAEHPNMCDLRIVLLGKNVSENSKVRNLILGIDLCETEEPSVLLRHNLMISGMVEDRHVKVINTLYLLNAYISEHQVTQRVRECVSMSDPGPHVFILVLQYNDFSEEDLRRAKHVLHTFSKEAMKRTIVIITDKKSYRSMISSMISHTEQLVNQLIKECGGGHLQLGERKSELQSDIFKIVDKILKENQESFIECDINDHVRETSVDEEPFSSDGENPKSSHYSNDGKSRVKTKKGSDEGVVLCDTGKESPKFTRPNMSAKFPRKQKLNLVVCGNNTAIKISMSKLLRGKRIKSSHERAVKSVCEKKEEKIDGRQLSVVELPALSRLSEEEVMRQTLLSVTLCHPGVHAFIIIVHAGPLNNDEKSEIQKILNIFDSREHFILLFTSDLTVDKPVTEFVKSSPESQRLISRCGGQYRLMGLKEPENSRQIPDLLDYIENMKTEPYSPRMYVKAQEKRVRRETEEKLREMEKKIEELQQKIQSESCEDEADSLECLRIVLIGKTGNGKSATGNTILGRDEFHSQLRPDSVTTFCQKGVGEVDSRSVAVVDTPGLFDTTLTNEQAVEEIMKCVSLSSPGPHVFVIVVSLGRFTKEEIDTMQLIKKIFGYKAAQFSIVLFTRGDDLENESIQDYVTKYNSAELKKLIRDCENRFLVFNNREKQDRTQVIQLIKMIEEVKNTNQGRYFTNSMFEEAEMNIKKRMEEILKDREKEIQKQREELQAQYEREMKNMMKRLEEEKQRADEERMKMENRFRENEEKLRKEFEEKEKTEQKKRETENQKRLEEEKQQRAEYIQKIEEMKRETENQRSEYEKQQREREEEDRKREERYRQDKEKMRSEQRCIIAELQMKQKEEIKKRDDDDQQRNKVEEEERQKWERKIKEAENERKDIKEEIKQQQREWEDEKKRQMREREDEERKRKEKHEEQLREKQEELEIMRKRFKREREEERQKIEEERQKRRREREEKETDYEEKKQETKRHYEQLERERKEEWERRKQEDKERREEERKRWKKKIEDLKEEQEERMKRREREEEERKEKEEKERDEMKQKHEQEIKVMKKKHEDEARKQAEEFHDFRERNEKDIHELKQMLEEHHEQYQLLEKLYQHLHSQREEEMKGLLEEVEKLKNKSSCNIL